MNKLRKFDAADGVGALLVGTGEWACRAAHRLDAGVRCLPFDDQCHSSSRSRRTASLAGFFDLSHVFDGPTAIGRMALLVCQIQMFQTPL